MTESGAGAEKVGVVGNGDAASAVARTAQVVGDTSGGGGERPVRAQGKILTDIDAMRELIASAKSVALVGVSGNIRKASYFVLTYLSRTGLRLYPVNPNYPEILNYTCYPSLRELPERPDIVDIFLSGDAVERITEEAIAVGAGSVWMQLGISNRAAAERAASAGLQVVQNRCIKLEHGRWSGKMRTAGLNTGVFSSRRVRKL